MEPTTSSMLTGHVAGGQIVLDMPLDLPEGAAVQVVVTTPQAEPSSKSPKSNAPLREQLARFLSHQVDDLPPDAAENHDHYLYGTPKQ
jgi:hypothetical protein